MCFACASHCMCFACSRNEVLVSAYGEPEQRGKTRLFALREIFSEFCYSTPNMDCSYHFPIDLDQLEFRLVLNQSKNGNYDSNLVWLYKILNRFLCVCAFRCNGGETSFFVFGICLQPSLHVMASFHFLFKWKLSNKWFLWRISMFVCSEVLCLWGIW